MSTIESLERLRGWANDRLDGYAHADAIRFADEIEAETAEMREFCERVEKAAKARDELEVFGTAYMPLPLDADGVPIRVRDELECHANGYDGAFTVFAIGNDVVVGDHDIEWVARNPTNWFHVASFCTHAKPRTLEDVLFEFGEEFEGEMDEIAPVIAKYAEEIRELMGGAE